MQVGLVPWPSFLAWNGATYETASFTSRYRSCPAEGNQCCKGANPGQYGFAVPMR